MARPFRVEHRLDGTTVVTVLLIPDGQVNIVTETIVWQRMSTQQREAIVDQVLTLDRPPVRSRR